MTTSHITCVIHLSSAEIYKLPPYHMPNIKTKSGISFCQKHIIPSIIMQIFSSSLESYIASFQLIFVQNVCEVILV